ncbi:MAG: helix-turn-helix transcriptional regulator [Bacteroidales bacterium]|nr:helix-turn-helix transcriptional regulator [Bacteroidales bacterium]
MNYNKIKELAESRKVTIKDLAIRVGYTEAGLHKAIRNKSIKVDSLENIAQILGVPISSFFDETFVQSPAKAELKSSEKKYQITIQLKVDDEIKEKEILKMVFGNEFIKLINK